MPNMPCKDCVPPKRQLGCHGYCEEYLAVVAEREKIKEKRRLDTSIKILNKESAQNGRSIRSKFKKQ